MCVFSGVALGERSETDLTFDVSMITLDKQSYNYRAQERKLATSFVWCIAKTNVSDTDLQSSLDWACGPGTDQGQVNCGPVQVGGSCYDPNTLYNHASWAFNAYFQRMNAIDEACVFAGTAQKTTVDPSERISYFNLLVLLDDPAGLLRFMPLRGDHILCINSQFSMALAYTREIFAGFQYMAYAIAR